MRRPTQTRRKHLWLSLLVWPISTLNVNAAVEQALDKRVTDSMTYSQLVQTDPWQKGAQPTDWNQQMRGCISGIINTPGGFDARRAQNLAATKHFAEAIGEWTRAIDSYDVDNAQQYSTTLDPEWLLSRARLFIKIGRIDEALADIERSVTLKRSSEQSKFNAALLFTELGKYSRAESVLPAVSDGHPLFRPYYSYLLAVVQEKQGKKELAEQTFLESATLFAAAGMTPPAEACLNAVSAIGGPTNKRKQPLKLTDLKQPKSNYKNIEKLLTALATRTDVFDLGVLKELTGAASFKESSSGYFVSPHRAHFPEISLINIDKLESGGKRLNIHIEPVLCSINKTALKGLLNNPVEAPEQWRKDVAYSEGYRVPAGTLVLSIRNGGFGSIWWAQLYSKDATFPEPPRKPRSQSDTPPQRNYARLMGASEALEHDNVDYAEKTVNDWLRENPEDPRAHMLQAEIFSKKGNLNGALTAIDTAIKYSDRDKLLDTEYTGNIPLIRKGTYLLEQGKFEEAYKTFERAFPDKPSADLLLLRAKSEIGLKRITEAIQDLNAASKSFYDEGRIIRRDEAEKLLNSIRGKVYETPVSHSPTLTPKEIEAEHATAGRILHQLQQDKQKRALAKENHDQESISKTAKELILAAPHRQARMSAYILAMLKMSHTATNLGQRSSAQSYMDKAIECYATYRPQTDYDACTRILISQLRELGGSQFEERLEKVARRSELFCNNEDYRRKRDDAFIDLCRGEDSKIAMLEKLIDIRKEQQPSTGVDPESLRRRLPNSYRGEGQHKALAEYFPSPSNNYTDRPNSTIETELNETSQALIKVEQVLTSIGAKDTKQSEHLIKELEQETVNSPCPKSFQKAILQSQYLAIAEGYLEQGSVASANDFFRKAIDTVSDTTTIELTPFAAILSRFRITYEASEAFPKVESLYDYVLNRLERITINDITAVTDIKMSFAEVLLNHERHLQDKSQGAALKKKAEGLFAECLQRTTNQIKADSSIEKIRLRRILATKYPALVKLDLPNGAIDYEEHAVEQPASIAGLVLDGRTVRIIGPHSIIMTDKGNGRQSILMDGQTFTDKAMAKLDTGKLSDAEQLFVLALRADPDSDAFGLLGECWYLQGNIENALQASSMALEVNKENAHAAAIQRLCLNSLKYPEKLGTDNAPLLKVAIAPDSSEKPMTVAISLLALGKLKEAKLSFSKILKKYPGSFRASTFKSKCRDEN